jgi:acetyl esterase/lipase
MSRRLWLALLLACGLNADVRLQKPGLVLDAQPGNSRISFPVPVKPGEVYERATIAFRMHIGKLQPVFNAFVDMTRPAGKNYFAMQIRADKSKTLVDKMDHTQYGEVAAWKENTEYRVQIVYDTVAGTIVFEAFNPDGSRLQRMETSIANRLLVDGGKGIEVGFGLNKVYDNAYYPPWTWKFYDLDVTLTPLHTPYWKTTYTYKTAGNLPIQADVYRSPDTAPRPVILWLHGGALIFGHRGNLPEWQARQYVDAGYAVVAADYRLAPESKLPEILDDLKDAWLWVRERGPSLFGADAEHMAVVGHSAGAYLTLMSGFLLDSRPRALVSFYGYGDITGPWQTQPVRLPSGQKPVGKEQAYAAVGTIPLAGTNFAHQRFTFYAYSRQQGIWPNVVTAMDPAQRPADFRRYCPILNIDSRYPPTLLLHGDADKDVPFAQSEAMQKELAGKGVKSELIRIKDGGHVFDGNEKDPQVTAAFRRVLEFLKANLVP